MTPMLKRVLRRILLSAFILFGIVIAGALLIQTFLSSFLQNYVRSELGWSLKIGSADIQFQPLSVRLENIELSAGGQKPFFQAKSASASLPYSSFWSEEFLIRQLTLDSPRVDLDLLPTRSGSKNETAQQTKAFRIDSAIVQQGEVQFKENQFKEINIDTGIDSQEVRMRKLTSKYNDIYLQIEGAVKGWDKPELDLSYEVQGDAAGIASLFPSEMELKGAFSASGTAKGALLQPIISGHVECANMILRDSVPFSIAAQYQYDSQNQSHPISVTADFGSVPLEVIGNYWQEMPQFSSTGSGTVHYSGDTDFWKGEGDIAVGLEPKIGAKMPLAGKIHARLQNGLLQIHSSNLRLQNSNLSANGTLSENQLLVNADFQSSRLKDIAFLYPGLALAHGEYQVHAQLAGAYRDINVRGEITGRSGESTIEAKGSTRTGTRMISVEFHGNAEAEFLHEFLPDLQKGEVQFEGSVLGTWDKPVLNASLNGTALQIGEIELQQLSAQVETKGNRLLFHATSADLQLQADGSYRLSTGEYELTGRANGTSMETLLNLSGKQSIPVQGKVDADFEAAGNVHRWKQSNAALRIQAPELQWKDVLVSISDAEILAEKGIAHLNAHAASPNIQLDLGGTVLLQSAFPLDLQINGKIAGEVLEKISSDWKSDGELNFDAKLRGTASHPKLEGKLTTENFNVNYLPNKWNIALKRAEVGLAEQQVNVEGNGDLNGSTFQWKGNIPVEGGNGNLHFEIADLPISMLSSNANVSGNLNVVGELQGKGSLLKEWRTGETVQMPFHEWSGRISVSPSDLRLGKNEITVEEPMLLTIQNQEISLASTHIRSGDLLDFQGSGSLNLETGKIESAAHLAAKIDLLSNLQADIQSSGPVTMDLRLSGTMKKPEYQGTIQLTHASLRIPDSPLILEELDLEASLNNNGLRLDKLQARSGGGTITGGGELVTGRKGSEVWIQGKNVATNYPEGLRSQTDFDMKLTALESGALLSGDVRVLRSFYEQELSLKNPIVKKLLAATTQLTAEKRLKNKLQLAVNIRTIQDLRLKNNLLIVRVGGDLKVEGTAYKPRLAGLLTIREGSRIFLLGNQYDVEKATVEFFGSELIEPNLDITISSLLRDFQSDTYYEVFLPFGGPMSNIEFKNVRSNPSLSQDQIFSLVAQGTVESDQPGTSNAIIQRQLVSFLAGQALGAPSAAIAKSIGLSRIQVQQEGLSSVNDPETRLMLGKDIGAGFSLIYSFVLNDPQEQTWIATYRYGRNIIGRFIDQDDGTYTVSVSHKIPFGKGVGAGSLSYQSWKKDRGPLLTSIEWKNDSSLTDKQVQELLEIEVGDHYDYWVFQDRADELKKEFQKMGYLYPVVDVRESYDEKGLVSLTIEIHSGDSAEMIFSGYEIGEKLLNRYKRMWRTGISATVVQQMIQEDFLRQLQSIGFYKASVNTRTEQTNARTLYYFEATPGTRFTSVELEFQGAKHYDPKILQKDLGQLYLSSADLFRDAIHKPSDFADKIKMLYARQGYLQTTIEPGPVRFPSDSGKIVSVVQIEEGPLSQIAGVTATDGEPIPDSLRTKLKLVDGQTFYPDALLDDELKIRDFYESQGYQDVSVRYNIDFTKGTTNLLMQWAVNAGPIARIASIRIEGNESTRADLIRKQIGLKEGDVLTQNNQSLARKRLSDLGVFQQIGLETEETDDPGLYDVVIRVAENKKYEFQYGGRYNTDDKFGAEIRLSDFNFLGRAQNLSLYVRSTLDLPLFRIDYTMPITGTFWDRTRFSLFRDETDEDVRATISGETEKIPFVKKQMTGQFQQERRLWSFYRLLWGFEYGSLTADFQDLDTRVPIQFQGTEALVHGAFLADRRDDPLNSTHGYFYSVDGEFAPTLFGSDISYTKNFSQFFYYKKIGGIVWASGARAGFLSIRGNILTFAEKFRTGGSTTLRGFQNNTVIPEDQPGSVDDGIRVFFGGDSVLILNQEIRFPIYKWFSGATFLDAGNSYFHVSDFDPTDLRYSAGFGVRAGAGGFLIRFDLGINLDPEEDEPRSVFHFGIGQAF